MRLLTSILSLFIFASTYAQDGWDWGNNKPEAQGKWFLVNQLIKSKDFQRAKPEIHWLLNNAPNLKEDLYIQASKVYEMVERKAPQSSKVSIQDSVLFIYDTRLAKYGDSSNVYNRKGLVYYRYKYKQITDKEVFYNFYSNVFELNKNDTYSDNLLTLMKLAYYQKKYNKMTESEVLKLYQRISNALNVQKMEAEKNGKTSAKKAIENNEAKVIETLLKTVDVTCDFVKSNYGEKLKQNPQDIDVAKNIYNLMLEQKCYDEPLFQEAMQLILEKEPSYTGYKKQGHIFMNQKKYNDAIVSYKKAVELTSDSNEKGELYLSIAKVYAQKESKTQARDYAKKCIQLNYHTKDAYLLIGNLYMYSYDDCKVGDPVEDRLIYIAAYNMYAKANNQAKMNEAKTNFPSGGDIHMHNMTIGENVKIDCWINETVQVQKRN